MTPFVRSALILTLCAPFFPPNVSGLINYGKDNAGNVNDPGTGVPWANVARVTNATGTLVDASAVYLRDGYMITANHVGNRSHVTFDGTSLWEVDPDSYQQVAPGVDLKTFRLKGTPDLPPVMLYEDSLANQDLSTSSVLIGWGVGRDPSVAIDTAVVAWGTNATQAQRWGTNKTLPQSQIVTYTSGTAYSYDALRTRLLTSGGADEAAMTLYDSGGALFQFIDNTWYLSGIATVVSSENSQSIFGNNSTGDLNHFARISTYSDAIQATIPEPGHIGAGLAFGALATASFLRRRRARNQS